MCCLEKHPCKSRNLQPIHQHLQHKDAFIYWISWGYLLTVASLWIAVFWGDDDWWLTTMILFGPRWFALLPLVVLMPLAVWKNRRVLLPLLLAALIVLGPFMGLQVHLPLSAPTKLPRLRVLTCNVDGNHSKQELLSAMIANSNSDIIAFQESPDRLKKLLPPSWYLLRKGEFMIFSRYPLKENDSVRQHQNMLVSTVRTPMGDVTFCTVHLPSTRYGLTDILDNRTILNPSRKGLLLLQTRARRQASEDVQHTIAACRLPVIVAGDFNLLEESTIYREYWRWYRNAFSSAGFGYGWTQRTKIRKIPNVVRVDHVLLSNDLRAVSCRVGSDVGSDHLPLIADVVYEKIR